MACGADSIDKNDNIDSTIGSSQYLDQRSLIMASLQSTAAELRAIKSELEERGASDLSERVERIIADVNEHAEAPRTATEGQSDGPVERLEMMSTGEAAEILGIKSVNTIKRWVRLGLLEGFRRGGRVVVSKRSVQQMADMPAVRWEKDFDRRMEDAADFGANEDELTQDSAASMVWSGRKPWEQDVHAQK
jgi:hypothetical protein